MKSLDDFARNGEIAQGYVRIKCWDETGKVTYDSLRQKNAVVNDARRSAAAAFANQAGAVGLGFRVKQYRCGYSNTLTNHWDTVNNRPMEALVTDNALLPMYTGSQAENYFHTQADVSGAVPDGRHWVGAGNALVNKAIPLAVTYPVGGDEYAVELQVTLDSLTSVGATFDTVEVILANGVKFAHRFTYPIIKAPGWNLGITHLVLF